MGDLLSNLRKPNDRLRRQNIAESAQEIALAAQDAGVIVNQPRRRSTAQLVAPANNVNRKYTDFFAASTERIMEEDTPIPMLKFSNQYKATDSLVDLFRDEDQQLACLYYLTKNIDGNDLPTRTDVTNAMFEIVQGITLSCVGNKFPKVDVHRLAAFAQRNGFVRRFKRYPVFIRSYSRLIGTVDRGDPMRGYGRLDTARQNSDGIGCIVRYGNRTLDKIVEDDEESR